MDTRLHKQNQWFVLRDFKKWNAKSPAYVELPKLGIRCFTPMHWIIVTTNEKHVRRQVPVIQNLLFAYDTREVLDPIIKSRETLQYQFMRGHGSGTPMIVDEKEMERFITAVSSDPAPKYYSPEEIKASMIGEEIIVTGGPLDGHRGKLLRIKGSKKKRLIVEVQGFLVAAVEINPEFIQLA